MARRLPLLSALTATTILLSVTAHGGRCGGAMASGAAETLSRYERTVAEIIDVYVEHGRVPDTAQVRALQCLEAELLALAAQGCCPREALPPLELRDAAPRDPARIPGLLVCARLRATGIDPLADGLPGRTFVLPVHVKP